ncbi:tetratricopeptide repeat protein [Paractinoplanes durhamensis]
MSIDVRDDDSSASPSGGGEIQTNPDAGLPDPGAAATLDDLVVLLRALKIWAGNPSFDVITQRINAGWTAAGRPAAELARRGTVVDCFKTGRRRVNADLIAAVAQALHPDAGYVAQWRQALRVVSGESRAAAQVRAQDRLPDDLAEFTGRAAQLARLRDAPPVVAVEGMAGVGKTRLAIHAGHLLGPFDQVLFADLRGFHPAQPPADPAAVLESFLELLGVPAQRMPHDLDGRAAHYADLLAGRRTLVVLDNAVDEQQVRPLLAGTRTIVTSRRRLDLPGARRIALDVFSHAEAAAFLGQAVAGVPVGADPGALGRVADRCGRPALALGLVAGHIRTTAGWTVADHADRLDERHRDRRLDTGVSLALDLSYQHLPADRRRLLRLLALHPGHDVDAYAAAALAGSDLDAARGHLDDLATDHLLQRTETGRYVFHDLVRAFTAERTRDEDAPRARQAAVTRLFDHYLATAAAAMDVLHPAEKHRRPAVDPVSTPAPDLTDPDDAVAWLNRERVTLIAVAAQRSPAHTVRLSRTLFRYLNGGHNADALILHGHARAVAQQTGDLTAEAQVLTQLGTAYTRLGRYDESADHLRQALELFRRGDNRSAEAPTLTNLGQLEVRLGHYEAAAGYFAEARDRHREAGDVVGEVRGLAGLGLVQVMLGRPDRAVEHHTEGLALARKAGSRMLECELLSSLGDAERRVGDFEPAGLHLRESLAIGRQLGNRTTEGFTLDCIGILETDRGNTAAAVELHEQALVIFRETGDREGDASAYNGLGDAANADGRPAEAISAYGMALGTAVEIGDRYEEARAHTGLGRACAALGRPGEADRHFGTAIEIYTALHSPEADRVRGFARR